MAGAVGVGLGLKGAKRLVMGAAGIEVGAVEEVGAAGAEVAAGNVWTAGASGAGMAADGSG